MLISVGNVPAPRPESEECAADAMPDAPAAFIEAVIEAAPGKSMTARLRWCALRAGISEATLYRWRKTGMPGNAPLLMSRKFLALADELKVAA